MELLQYVDDLLRSSETEKSDQNIVQLSHSVVSNSL